MKQIFSQLLLLITILSTTTLFSYGQGIGRSGIADKPQVKPVLSAEQIAKQYLPGIALIVCEDGKDNYSQGSGFFVAPGMILTNAHVVKGMVRGFVVVGKEKNKYSINAVAYFNFENTDLALLVSDESKAAKTPVLPLARANDLTIGETIYVLSNPKGLSGTISQGIVSSEVRKTKKMDLLQITAPISAGSSGGAVLNARGEVIGTATSSLESGQNLNFAVPAARIRLFLEEFNDGLNKTEYVRASELTDSWIAPKSSLNESIDNDKKQTFPINPGNTAKPTFREAGKWLTEKLEGTSVTSNSNTGVKKIEELLFSQCKMHLAMRFIPIDEPVELLETYYKLVLCYVSFWKLILHNDDPVSVWLARP